MRMRTSILIAACILLVGLAVLYASPATPRENASSAPIPAIIQQGLDAYEKDGAEAATKQWFQGSPLEDTPNAFSTISGVLKKVEALYGKYDGASMIRIVDLTPKSRLIYLAINYETGAVLCRFVLYKTKSTAETITQVNFQTDPEKLLPESMLAGTGQ